jgi:hypothetical protein
MPEATVIMPTLPNYLLAAQGDAFQGKLSFLITDH